MNVTRRRLLMLGGVVAASAIGTSLSQVSAIRSVLVEDDEPAAPWWIAGDSIGEGLRWASGEPGSTKRGLPLIGGRALNYLRMAPVGAHLVISLGTNDAVAHAFGDALAKDFADIVDLIRYKRPARWTWVGPVDPLTARADMWGASAHELDYWLNHHVLDAGGRYVSQFNMTMADGTLLYKHHAKDGVHFGLAGYKRIWAEVVKPR